MSSLSKGTKKIRVEYREWEQFLHIRDVGIEWVYASNGNRVQKQASDEGSCSNTELERWSYIREHWKPFVIVFVSNILGYFFSRS